MKRACCDCAHLEYSGSCRVTCSRHPAQRVKDPDAHIQQYVCDQFEPQFLRSETEGRGHVMVLLREVAEAGCGGVSVALGRWLAGPPNDVEVAAYRGLAMLSVADGGLQPFEHEDALKTYEDSNHLFADLLVPASGAVKRPILFWVSRSNRPGVELLDLSPVDMACVALGEPYTFTEVVQAIEAVLGRQGVVLDASWFRAPLRRHGLDPAAVPSIVGTAPPG